MSRGEPGIRSSARREVVLVLLAAFIAAAAGLGGAYLGSHTAIVTQRDQARDSQLADAREKRARVYRAFLGRAQTFAASARRLTDELESVAAGRPSAGLLTRCARSGAENCRPPEGRTRIDPKAVLECAQVQNLPCRDLIKAFAVYDADQAKHQRALNDVYVYGSRSGVRAARRLAAALPPAVHSPDARGVGFSVDDAKLGVGYNAVLDVMCREVSADPRPSC